MISHASWDDDGPQAPSRLQGRVFWLLARAARNAQQATQTSLVAAGMHRGFYGVLATLDEFGPGSQADIGRRLGLDPSDMVDIINDLERQGYVARQPDPADRRRNKVTLTAAGTKALGRFDAAITEAEDALLAVLPQAERAQLTRALTRLVTTGDSAAADPARRRRTDKDRDPDRGAARSATSRRA